MRDEGRVRVRDSNSDSDDYSDSDIIIKNMREQILEQSRAGQIYIIREIKSIIPSIFQNSNIEDN